MRNLHFLSLLLVFITLWGCTENDNQQDLVIQANNIRWLKNCDDCNNYVVNINHVKLHKNATKDSKLLGYLKEGQIVRLLDDSESMNESFTLRGVSYDEPWVEIKTKKGTIGWIFRGALDVISKEISSHTESIIETRLINTFGYELKEAIKESSTNIQFKNIVDVMTFYKESKALLPEVNKIIRNDFISRANVLPQLEWLEVCFPFCSIYQSNNNYYYFLDFDYDKMLEIAHQTADDDDDRFIELLISLNKNEEGFVINKWENINAEGKICNNIGQGDYTEILKAINLAYTNNVTFKEEILVLKKKVIKSLVRNRKNICLDSKDVYNEILQIIKDKVSILSNEDIGELRELSKRFR